MRCWKENWINKGLNLRERSKTKRNNSDNVYLPSQQRIDTVCERWKGKFFSSFLLVLYQHFHFAHSQNDFLIPFYATSFWDLYFFFSSSSSHYISLFFFAVLFTFFSSHFLMFVMQSNPHETLLNTQ
jgi:hypothetical protein